MSELGARCSCYGSMIGCGTLDEGGPTAKILSVAGSHPQLVSDRAWNVGQVRQLRGTDLECRRPLCYRNAIQFKMSAVGVGGSVPEAVGLDRVTVSIAH